jgi:hypothetical protein
MTMMIGSAAVIVFRLLAWRAREHARRDATAGVF